MADAVDKQVKEHDARLNGHDAKLKEHAQLIADLQDAHEKLGKEVTAIHGRLENGFSQLNGAVREMTGEVQKVRTEAMSAVPQTIANVLANNANRLGTHALVFQVIGVCALVATAAFTLIKLLH